MFELPHFRGREPPKWGLSPWNSSSAKIFVHCTYPQSFIIRRLSCIPTNNQTNIHKLDTILDILWFSTGGDCHLQMTTIYLFSYWEPFPPMPCLLCKKVLHFGGQDPPKWGLCTWHSNLAKIFVQCIYPPPSIIILCLIVRKLSCSHTYKQTNKEIRLKTSTLLSYRVRMVHRKRIGPSTPFYVHNFGRSRTQSDLPGHSRGHLQT